jgi:hypothetical protein
MAVADRIFACSLCNSRMVATPVTFMSAGRLWSLTVWLCHRPTCLDRRGGVSTVMAGPSKAGTWNV